MKKVKEKYVDKAYRLKNHSAPLAYMLASKHTRRSPLLYFDEEANSNSMDYEPEREYYEKIYSTFHRKIKNEFDLEKSFKKMIKKLDTKSEYCFSLNMTSVEDFINFDTYFIIKTELFERFFRYSENFMLEEIDGRILKNE